MPFTAVSDEWDQVFSPQQVARGGGGGRALRLPLVRDEVIALTLGIIHPVVSQPATPSRCSATPTPGIGSASLSSLQSKGKVEVII